MHAIIARVLSVRSIAAVASLGTSALIFVLAGPSEFGRLAVALSAGGVLTLFFYQAFSKFALISTDPRALATVFLKEQRVIVLLLSILSVAAPYVLNVDFITMLVVSFWAASQGTKDFLGQVLRRCNCYDAFSGLYVMDALLTLLLTAGIGLSSPTLIGFILASTLSSFVVVAVYWGRVGTDINNGAGQSLLSIVTYSAPIVAANSLAGVFLTVFRRMLNVAAGPEIGGTLNFIYELIQKPMSLISSSIVTAVVPILQSRSDPADVRAVGYLYIASLFVLMSVPALAQISGLAVEMFGPSVVSVCLLILVVFLNKLKSGFVELPFMLVRRPLLILPGNIVGLAFLLFFFWTTKSNTEATLMLTTQSQVIMILLALIMRVGHGAIQRAVRLYTLKILGVVIITASAFLLIADLGIFILALYLVFCAVFSTAFIFGSRPR